MKHCTQDTRCTFNRAPELVQVAAQFLGPRCAGISPLDRRETNLALLLQLRYRVRIVKRSVTEDPQPSGIFQQRGCEFSILMRGRG